MRNIRAADRDATPNAERDREPLSSVDGLGTASNSCLDKPKVYYHFTARQEAERGRQVMSSLPSINLVDKTAEAGHVLDLV